MTKCKVCKKSMNPVEVMMGDTCGTCAKKVHKFTVEGVSYDDAVKRIRGEK